LGRFLPPGRFTKLPFEPPAYSGGEHDDWSDGDQGSDSWADQFDWFSEHVSEITGIPEDVLRERDDFLEDYERAFGLEQGDMALHGFSELSQFGRWTIGHDEYVAHVRNVVSDVGRLQWAACQDWMCEPQVIAKTGLSIPIHQERTIDSYIALMTTAPEIPWAPVLQGYGLNDYKRHVDAYLARGIDLFRSPVVGLGSVCRRQATDDVEQLIDDLATAGLRLHGFGFKLGGLRRVASRLTSADSMARSFDARREGYPMFPECIGDHINCANCLRYALSWRKRVLACS
jgi:hypothetical protein